jgi:predicted phage terminase large subunit-like protein
VSDGSLDPCIMAQQSFASYCALAYPNYNFAPHLDILIQMLEMIERREITLGMIFMPPRHGKSLTATELFPAWYHGKHPDHKVMIGCHTQSLANRMGDKVRRNVNSREHQIVFPDCRMTKESRAKHEYALTAGGEFYATGVGGGATGRGGDLLIIDDPIKNAEDARSPVIREKLHEWYESVWRTRRMPNAAELIINTRWHEHDLAGWLLDPEFQDQVDEWKVLCMPAMAEEDEGWRQEGDALWPEKFPREVLEKIKRGKNKWVWAALYQQRPSAIEGMLFKRAWWREYVWNPHLAANRELTYFQTQPYQIVQSWDTALEEKEHNDYSVCETALVTPTGNYLLDVFRKRMIFPELCDKAVQLALYWRANVVLVEKKSSGHSLIQHLNANPKTRLIPVVPRVPRGDKLVRAQVISPYVEHGNWWLPLNAPWKTDFLNELSGFPTSANDDQVDSFSQLADYVSLNEWQKEKFGSLDEALDPIEIFNG